MVEMGEALTVHGADKK